MSGNLRLFDHGQERHGSNDYYTPAWIFEALDIEFDLDVSAPPGGVQWIPAKRYLTLADDGLTADWHGRVWMNPPYSNTTPWARRFITHANGIALLPHAKAIWHSEMMAQAEATCTPPQVLRLRRDRQPEWRHLPARVLCRVRHRVRRGAAQHRPDPQGGMTWPG